MQDKQLNISKAELHDVYLCRQQLLKISEVLDRKFVEMIKKAEMQKELGSISRVFATRNGLNRKPSVILERK